MVRSQSRELPRQLRLCGAAVAAALLGGCALYHPLPLARGPDLAGGLSALRTRSPGNPAGRAVRGGSRRMSRSPSMTSVCSRCSTIRSCASEQAQMDVARANLLQSSLLPNPCRQRQLWGAARRRRRLLARVGGLAHRGRQVHSDVPHSRQVGALPEPAGQCRPAVAGMAGGAEGEIAGARSLLRRQSLAAQPAGAAICSIRRCGRSRRRSQAGNLDFTALAPLLTRQGGSRAGRRRRSA